MKALFLKEIEIRASMPLRALDKLAAAGICLYSVEKCGAGRLKIRVKSKESKKIFAIFRGSCYTVVREKSVGLCRIAEKIRRRPGAVAGAVLFALLPVAANSLVFRIEVEGSAARYAEQAVEMLAEREIGPFRLYDADAAELARDALLQLPGVVFASVEKSGGVVTVTLEQSDETSVPERESSLCSPCAGVLEELTVLRGTPLAAAGDHVAAGQELAGGWFLTENGDVVNTFAVARASILCEGEFTYESAEQSEGALSRAVAAAHLACGGEPLEEQVAAVPQGGGYLYTVYLRYRVRAAVNLE